MSRPIDYRLLLQWLLAMEKRTAEILDGISAIKFAGELNQDNPDARAAVAQLALEVVHLAYRMTRHLESLPDGSPAAATDPVVLPNLPSGPALDKLIYAGAMQHIADVSRFSGNVARCSDPASHRRTVELLRDFGIQMAAQMDERLHPQPDHEPLALPS